MAGHACDWHAWKRPDIRLDHVHCVAVYVHPQDVPARDGWSSTLQGIVRNCNAFHEAQLPGSRLTWSLHGPMTLPFDTAALSGEDGANAFFELARTAITLAAASPASFPAAIAHSTRTSSAPSATATGDAAAADSAAVDIPSLPTMVCVTVFADWGQEDAGDGRLHKYFVWGAAAEAGAQSQLRDISRTGGSRAGFFGKVDTCQLGGILHAAGFAPSLAPSASASVRIHGPDAWRAYVAGTPLQVGFGMGIVTQEAWTHPELPGCAAVAYHEGLGHSLNMPHPSDDNREPNVSLCVMGRGMYQRRHLLDGLLICEEIKNRMRERRDGTSMDTIEKQKLRLGAAELRQPAAVAAALSRFCAGAPAEDAPTCSATTTANAKNTVVMWPCWVYVDEPEAGCCVTVLRRSRPVVIDPTATCACCAELIVPPAALPLPTPCDSGLNASERADGGVGERAMEMGPLPVVVPAVTLLPAASLTAADIATRLAHVVEDQLVQIALKRSTQAEEERRQRQATAQAVSPGSSCGGASGGASGGAGSTASSATVTVSAEAADTGSPLAIPFLDGSTLGCMWYETTVRWVASGAATVASATPAPQPALTPTAPLTPVQLTDPFTFKEVCEPGTAHELMDKLLSRVCSSCLTGRGSTCASAAVPDALSAWLPARFLTGPPPSQQAASHAFLLDSGRSLAIAVPVLGEHSWIGSVPQGEGGGAVWCLPGYALGAALAPPRPGAAKPKSNTKYHGFHRGRWVLAPAC